MSTKSTILISNYSDDSNSSEWYYSKKQKAAGFYKNYGGVHTATFTLDDFKGSIKIQATLSLYPGEDDWFDVDYDNADDQLTALDSTPAVSSAIRNFTGNFVWIRAAIQLEQGTVTEIRYNY